MLRPYVLLSHKVILESTVSEATGIAQQSKRQHYISHNTQHLYNLLILELQFAIEHVTNKTNYNIFTLINTAAVAEANS